MAENNAIIYGFHAVISFISKRPERVDVLLYDDHRQDLRMQKLLALANQKNIRTKPTSRKELAVLIHHEQHQGIVALINPQPMMNDLEDFLDKTPTPFLVVLDGVQDPHNLGACLRTANAAGVDAVIAPKDRAVGITPVVTKVASGATEYTPFFQVTNLARTLQQLKERAIWLFGTSERASQLYNEVELKGSLAIVMGSEGRGLRRLTEEHCDFLMRIPMYGMVPSLNVSVATGICLYEVVRQNYEKHSL